MAREQRLSAHLATRDGVKSRTNREFTNLQRSLSTTELFNGFSKTYEAKDDDGETFPAESTRVRQRSVDLLEQLRTLVSEQFDASATVDSGNVTASSDVVVGDTVILSSVPVTTLLMIEKDLTQVRQFIASIPTLDPTYNWTFDQASGVFKTSPVQTRKTKKVQKPIVLYDATPEHPAQTQLISEDKIIGTWSTIRSSGAIPQDDKKAMLKRCDQLIDAVKTAREEANAVKVEPVTVGQQLFDFILG